MLIIETNMTCTQNIDGDRISAPSISTKSSCSSSSSVPVEPPMSPIYDIGAVKSMKECDFTNALYELHSTCEQTTDINTVEDAPTSIAPPEPFKPLNTPIESILAVPDWLYNLDSKNYPSFIESTGTHSTTIIFDGSNFNDGEQSLIALQLAGIGTCATNDDCESILSGGYFDPTDFNRSIWIKALNGPSFGFALVALATAITHPLLFVAGAVTAYGMLHVGDAVYDCCFRSDEPDKAITKTDRGISIGDLKKQLNGSNEAKLDIVDAMYKKHCLHDAEQKINSFKNEALHIVNGRVSSAIYQSLDEEKDNKENQEVQRTEVVKKEQSEVQPVVDHMSSHRKEKVQIREKVQVSINDIDKHYPALKFKVAQDFEFPGLSANEFLEVFFDDGAPFDFRDLQIKRGDVDINYQVWETLDNTSENYPEYISMHPRASVPIAQLNSFRALEGRICTYKAKTNSFIGPAYATTKKAQRTLLVSKKLAIIENKTTLTDVPFCDKFYVLDRWIITAEKVQDRYVSKLSASTDVIFTGRCNFESQIRSKSTSAIAELIIAWCAMATEALKQTEKAKNDRLRQELIELDEDCENDCLNTESESDMRLEQKPLHPPESEGVETQFEESKEGWGIVHENNNRVPHVSLQKNKIPSTIIVSSGIKTSISSAIPSQTKSTTRTTQKKRRFRRKLAKLLSM